MSHAVYPTATQATQVERAQRWQTPFGVKGRMRLISNSSSRPAALSPSAGYFQEPPRARELRTELRQRHIAHALAGLRCRDRGSLRDHELDVAAALGEQQVARQESREADRTACGQLVPARPLLAVPAFDFPPTSWEDRDRPAKEEQ